MAQALDANVFSEMTDLNESEHDVECLERIAR
jgi:hypothetical protein